METIAATKIQDRIMEIKRKVESGHLSCLDGVIELEALRGPLEDALKLIKGYKDEHLQDIQAEAEQYPDGFKGFIVEVRSGGRTFNYKHIPAIAKITEELEKVKEQHKQAFIAKEKGLLTASEDGEEIELPTITIRKSSLVLKKMQSA